MSGIGFAQLAYDDFQHASWTPDANGGTFRLIDKVFTGWGISYTAAAVARREGRRLYALSINSGFGQRPVRHIGLVGLDSQAMDPQDVITAGLESINLGTPGHFTAVGDEGGATLTPLLTSSTAATLS